jgi:hypothetical protein
VQLVSRLVILTQLPSALLLTLLFLRKMGKIDNGKPGSKEETQTAGMEKGDQGGSRAPNCCESGIEGQEKTSSR